MSLTQVAVHPAVAEKTRNVLSACRDIRNPRAYAHALVRTVADATDSRCAVWLNWPVGPDCIVAETEGVNPLVLSLIRDTRLPLLANDWSSGDGVQSIVAAPVRFRASVAGV